MPNQNARERAPNPVYNAGAELWALDPKRAFQIWLADATKDDGKPFGAATMKVYVAMWSTFVKQLAARRGKLPNRADDDDIRDFLDHAPACRRAEARARYRLLLRRVYRSLASDEPGRPDPSSVNFHLRERRAPDKPMPFLSAEQRVRVFEELAAPTDFDDPAGQMLGRAKAMCALMLGGGFKPGQARITSVECVRAGPERFLIAPALGLLKEHRALVDARAWPAIEAWLDWRASGPLLFPGRGDGADHPLDYARAFIGVKALLATLGMVAGAERVSPQTLRNSYGASLIEQGYGIDALREYMGFERLEFARRFVHGHTAWLARLAVTHPPVPSLPVAQPSAPSPPAAAQS